MRLSWDVVHVGELNRHLQTLGVDGVEGDGADSFGARGRSRDSKDVDVLHGEVVKPRGVVADVYLGAGVDVESFGQVDVVRCRP